jgi:hypothetical protein
MPGRTKRPEMTGIGGIGLWRPGKREMTYRLSITNPPQRPWNSLQLREGMVFVR